MDAAPLHWCVHPWNGSCCARERPAGSRVGPAAALQRMTSLERGIADKASDRFRPTELRRNMNEHVRLRLELLLRTDNAAPAKDGLALPWVSLFTLLFPNLFSTLDGPEVCEGRDDQGSGSTMPFSRSRSVLCRQSTASVRRDVRRVRASGGAARRVPRSDSGQARAPGCAQPCRAGGPSRIASSSTEGGRDRADQPARLTLPKAERLLDFAMADLSAAAVSAQKGQVGLGALKFPGVVRCPRVCPASPVRFGSRMRRSSRWVIAMP